MLNLNNVTIYRGANTLIENINLNVYEKNIIGLVGANGCGKSSLFAAIAGEIDIQAGHIDLKKSVRLVQLEQEVPALEMMAIDYTLSGNAELFKVLQDLTHAEECNDYDLMLQCHEKLDVMKGYDAKAKAAKILAGLGFNTQGMEKPVKTFSGGWRMRLNLAKCLFADSDLLLLDEPTNHLDLETVVWLGNFLKHYQGAVLMVSHDRDFLDSTVTHIAHVQHHKLKVYTGNYSNFEIQRAQQLALQHAKYKKQQAQIAHMIKFVDKFRYKATKAKQAQSRLQMIKKMELFEPIRESLPFNFQFMQPERLPSLMISLNKVDLGYDNNIVLNYVNFNISAGQRIGLLGLNGAGKSTLIKALVGELLPMKGSIERAARLQIGYFAQHQLDHMPMDATPLELLRELNPACAERDCINYLGSFAFNRDQSLTPLTRFSGGEKARVALALIVWQKTKFIVVR